MPTDVRLDPPAELDMPIGHAMFTQRAIRRLKPDPISDTRLELILDAASKAPNGGNVQPARFLVVRDREKIRAFGELYHEAWWAKRRDMQGWSGPEDVDERFRPAMQLADEIGNAPVVVLAFGVASGLDHSVLPAVQNLLLAARALGIGTTLTTLHPSVMDRVYALFKIPERVGFTCCIPMGYPRGHFGPTRRRPTSETTYYDEWKNPPPWATGRPG